MRVPGSFHCSLLTAHWLPPLKFPTSVCLLPVVTIPQFVMLIILLPCCSEQTDPDVEEEESEKEKALVVTNFLKVTTLCCYNKILCYLLPHPHFPSSSGPRSQYILLWHLCVIILIRGGSRDISVITSILAQFYSTLVYWLRITHCILGSCWRNDFQISMHWPYHRSALLYGQVSLGLQLFSRC